jgi:uncharacterized protein
VAITHLCTVDFYFHIKKLKTMQRRTVFSIVVPLAFLILHFGIRMLPKSGSYVEWVLTREILPLVLTGALIWWLHGRRLSAVPSAWGLRANALEAFGLAFVFCLPMLLGYAFFADFKPSITLSGFLIGCVWAAFSEELFYRGFVFGQLFRFGGWGYVTAGLLNALVFGSAHLYQAGDWGSAVGIFTITALGGLWFAWLYIEWGNNLWMPMAMHFFMNLWWETFEAGTDAAGGLMANVFRVATIAFSIVWTVRRKHRIGTGLEITRHRLMKNIMLSSSLLCCAIPVFAQKTLTGRVVDAATGEALAYVSIGIPGTSAGTVAGDDGQFKLEIPASTTLTDRDSIQFSLLGYARQSLPCSATGPLAIRLTATNFLIREVVVRPDNTQLEVLGKEKVNTNMSVNYAIGNKINQNLGSEIGRRFKIDEPSRLETFRFYVVANNFDTVRFRINVYDLVDGEPGDNILKDNIIVTLSPRQKGWISIDLRPYDIRLDTWCAVGVEWIYGSRGGTNLSLPIAMPVLGSKHFYKFGSRNRWKSYSSMSAAMVLEVRQ